MTLRHASLLLYISMIAAGWAYPVMGIGLLAFMGFVVLSGRRKKWCGSYCPRGSFLDLVMSRFSPKKPIPRWMIGRKAWAVAITLFIGMLGFQLHQSGLFGPWDSGSLLKLGLVFYRMCLVSSAVAIPLSLWKNHRAWCTVCPVGNILRA